MSNTAMQKASNAARQVYQAFMQDIVDQYVLTDRRGQAQLGDKSNQAIQNHKEIDTRTLYLCSISGKGGWTDNPKKQEIYLNNNNITLLDHLLSVTRGAIMLAASDLLLLNEMMDQDLLIRRLKVIAVIAFLHDLDKMEQLVRDAPLSIALVESAVKRYGIDAFLGKELSLGAEQIRFLIEHAEDTQAHRHPPTQLPPRYYEQDIKNYVALADKLDGIWQQYGVQGGLEQLIDRLQNTQGLHSNLLKQWQAVTLFDPHHPFLLDELQRNLSALSQHLAKIPPLIEIHQDGRLFVLLPAEYAEKIKQRALQRLCRYLPFSLYLNISTVGVPELINEKADYEQYQQFINEDIDTRLLAKIFTVKRHLVTTITPLMDELLGDIGLKPNWPKSQGQTSFPYADPNQLDSNAQKYLRQAASLALLLNLKVVKAKNIPDYLQREAQLLQLIDQQRPEWIGVIDGKEQQSRRVLTALWATVQAYQNPELHETIWGEAGLLQQWLEGTETQTGFREFFEDQGSQVLDSVKQHFGQLLQAQYLPAPNDKNTGHCIFTDRPTTTLIADKMKLYGVKVSAFAGRDGRPESVTSAAKGNVHISQVSVAEYKLRQDAFTVQGGKSSGVPSLVSSPVTTGLFSALILNNEQSLHALSVYDLQRKKVQKGKINYRGLEAYSRRYRMARFECMPTKLAEQINLLRLLLASCLRIGRPIHIFRGLPTWQKSFFYYDSMPRVLINLLGFKAFRIEQIPPALDKLNMAQELIDTTGLGHDVFQLYAMSNTRLRAVCLAWCYLRDRDTGSHRLRKRLEQNYLQLKQENIMSDTDGALVKLGYAAARIQRNPGMASSTNEETLTFSIALDTLMGLRAHNQLDCATLVHGIAGELETNLVRKDKMSAAQYREGKRLRDECMTFAQQFVDDIWRGVLKQRPPSQTSRRLLISVYRMAFLQASRAKNVTATAKNT